MINKIKALLRLETLRNRRAETAARIRTHVQRLIVWDRHHWWAKFVAAGVLMGVYAMGMGRYRLSEYYSLEQRESYLQEELEVYRPMLKADSARLVRLREMGRQVEYVARERYLMKSPGEDIYIVRPQDESERN